jgi:signal transduction histidine kinase
MRRRLRALSERNWRAIDRLFVVFLAAVAIVDMSANSNLRGPLWLNLVVLIGIALTFEWRRREPLVPMVAVVVGLGVMGFWLTKPPDTFAAVLLMVSAAYAVGRHVHDRRSVYLLAAGTVAIIALAISFDPHDIFFPVTFFWILPWVAGRTIRNHTMLARELAEKAERAEHARGEDERRAIAIERSRIARELHDVLAHNLSVMVVQAAAARRVLDKNPVQAVEVASLIERTGREALAEIRQLFGPVRRGDGEDLSGPPSIARLDELARRARAAGLRVELRVSGAPVALPAGIDLAAYRIVQEALTNSLKHAGSAQALVTVSYEPNEVVLSIEDDDEGPRDGYELSEAGGGHGLVGMRERAALYGGIVQAGRRRGGGFAVRARLPTRPLVPGAELSRTGAGKVPA